jgi:Tat protein secretion system quality control protein TatD with DNase activity
VEVAKKLAELHNTTLPRVADITTRSAEALFNL